MALPPNPIATVPRSFASSASRSSSARSASRDLRIRSAVCLFDDCERSFWHWTTMPVGRCVIRTAESVLLTCWPPAPVERYVSTRRSSGLISTSASSVSSSSGITSTRANDVGRRWFWSKGEIRTSRCTQLLVLLAELSELHQVAGAALEPSPRLDLLAVLGGLPGRAAGRRRVIPRARLGELLL